MSSTDDAIITVKCSNPECGNTWDESASLRSRRSMELGRMARECGAIPQGTFQLRSGVRSDRYLDGITLGLHGRAALVIGLALSEETRRANADVVAGPALGAAPMVAAAVSHRASEQGRKPLRGGLVRGSGRITAPWE